MVVTRFAPSPTGYLHIGGARTALFCWLLARHHGGRMILRIEDTDRRRNTPSAIEQVINDLKWLGIDWDEGPLVDGPNGPYFQSQRLDIYNAYLKQLLESGKAYYCFDTSEDLEVLRKQAAARKANFTYPRPKSFPSESDAEKAGREGRPVTVRFAVPPVKSVEVADAVRGNVSVLAGQIGDFIIRKADGFPTYHFACVVDDALMGVTHVIRGQEHLVNTHSHVLLQRALGFNSPVYAHMSVTISQDGGKLSKRQRPMALRKAISRIEGLNTEELAAAAGISIADINAFVAGESVPEMDAVNAMAAYLGVELPEINVADFFRSGYVPEAMLNFIAMLGWSPESGQEIMSDQDMIEAFDISRLAKSNSLFDRDKLVAFNTEHIRILGPEGVLGHLKSYLAAVDSPLVSADDALLKELVAINQGARTLADINMKSSFLMIADDAVCFDPVAVKKVLAGEGVFEMLATLRGRLAGMPLGSATAECVERLLKEFAAERKVGLGKVAQPLRVCLCGGTVSPPIFNSVALLGIERTVKRIDIALVKLGAES